MSSHKATLKRRMTKSSKEDGLMITGQENNFSYGVNTHKGMI